MKYWLVQELMKHSFPQFWVISDQVMRQSSLNHFLIAMTQWFVQQEENQFSSLLNQYVFNLSSYAFSDKNVDFANLLIEKNFRDYLIRRLGVGQG